MRPLLTVLVTTFVLIGSAPAADAARPASLAKTSKRFFRALIAGDVKACLALTPSHAELQATIKKPIAKKAYDGQVREFLERRVKEFAEGKKRHGDVQLERVEIADVFIVARGDKTRRTVAFGVVKPHLRMGKKTRGGFSFFFVQIGDRWRWSLKK